MVHSSSTYSMQPDRPYPRTLLIVDDPSRRHEIENALLGRGFVVSAPSDFDAATALLSSFEPDVVLARTGSNLRGVLRRVRAQTDCLALLIQSTSDETERIELLQGGADDVVTGPISDLEIIARCEAMLRRRCDAAEPESIDLVEVGPLTVDRGRHEVRFDGAVVPATRIEFSLLSYLASRPSQVVTREELLAEVWGPHWVGDAHVVDVHLSNIRRKLKRAQPDISVIRTVRGVGFRLSDDVLEIARPEEAVSYR